MKELDCVEVIVEKDKYARDSVHMGMNGWICDNRCIQGYWLVNFPQCGEKDDIAEIPAKEEDLKLISVMDAGMVRTFMPVAMANAPSAKASTPSGMT